MARFDGAGRDRHREHAAFLETGQASPRVRSVVAQSWIRSAAAGVNPDAHLAPVVMEHAELTDYRSAHPLAQVFPLLYDVLGRAAEACEYVMAVGDADGRLLWVCGPPGVLRRAEDIHFVEGAAWDELHAGTNAPGTALHLDTAVQIHSAEHFNMLVQPWTCAAAPIHDPLTQQILGLVDVTGGDDVASPQTLAMIRAAARMAELELARIAAVHAEHAAQRLPAAGATSLRLPGAVPPRVPGQRAFVPAGRDTAAAGSPQARPVLRLQALGRSECLAELAGRTPHLSRRHSEILVSLMERPEGLTAEELELEVYPSDVHASTMRAEMARLRGLLGADVLASRPYRLTVETDCDWHAATAHLAAGRVRDALRGYHGPLLPHSEAPGIVALRQSLEQQLRAAVLACGQPDLMVAWTRSRWGAEDLEMWQRQCSVLPAGSPLRPLAAAEAARLEREFADPS